MYCEARCDGGSLVKGRSICEILTLYDPLLEDIESGIRWWGRKGKRI